MWLIKNNKRIPVEVLLDGDAIEKISAQENLTYRLGDYSEIALRNKKKIKFFQNIGFILSRVVNRFVEANRKNAYSS